MFTSIENVKDLLSIFLNFRYQSEFGFTIPNRHIIVDDLRVRGAAHTQFSDEPLANVAQEEIAKPEKVF